MEEFNLAFLTDFWVVMVQMARLFSYVVEHDEGRSPNPFGSYCTLANCKFSVGEGDATWSNLRMRGTE